MEIGIAGLPGSGKTTLFNALARQHAHVGGYAGIEPNLAVVKVPDERLDKLSALFQPVKHTPAEVRFIDVAGVAKGMGQESSVAVLAHLRTVDVLLQVIGAFQAERDPTSDLEEFNLELQLADLSQIEKRVDRLEKELRLGSKGTPAERTAKERELTVLQRLRPVLEAGRPARTVALEPEEAKAIASFGFLTLKPTLVVLNLADEQNGVALVSLARDQTEAGWSSTLASADTLADIKAKGTLIVGVKADYPPYGFRDTSGKVVGLEPDMAADVAKRLGVALELVPVVASNRMQFLQQGKIDLMIATMAISDERRKAVGIVAGREKGTQSGANLLIVNILGIVVGLIMLVFGVDALMRAHTSTKGAAAPGGCSA